jgi:predicted transcriptional regulator
MGTERHTPRRSVRVAPGLWAAAQQVAQGRGESVSEVVVRALEQYVHDHEMRHDHVDIGSTPLGYGSSS